MQPGPPRRHPARPLGDDAAAALPGRVEDLAKGWLIALLEDAPLARAAEIPVADLAAQAPELCLAMVEALAQDAALAELRPGGSREALAARTARLAGAVDAEAASSAVDALAAVLWSAVCEELGEGSGALAAAGARLAAVTGCVRAAVLRERTPASGSAWRRRVEAAVADAAKRGAPLSLLLAEPDDAERLLAAEPPERSRAVLSSIRSALREALDGSGELTAEGAARSWVIARDCEHPAAVELAARLAGAVAAAVEWGGAPAVLWVGAATLGRDGEDASTLIDSAERAWFAAAAAAAAGGG